MTHPNSPSKLDGLEPFFQAGRAAQSTPDADLMARILGDATSVQTSFTPRPPVGIGFWSGFLDSLGGWRGVSALTACACFGLWVGMTTPQTITDFGVSSVASNDLAELGYSELYGLQTLLMEI